MMNKIKSILKLRKFQIGDKFIPYGRQTIHNDDIKNVIDVLKSDFLTQGPQIEIFERNISSFVGNGISIQYF